MEQALINRIVEAALLAASQPLTLVQLNGLFPLDEPAPEGAVQQALADLQTACAERGVELVEVASGWRYQVKADVHPWVARLWTERQTKYTRATLETLALIAYRQPITRGEIEQVRGVAVNSNIIKALEEREWIRVVGHRDIPGRPELLGTTKAFLDYFGLKRLDELPPLSELKDFGELEPQLEFDDAPRAVGDIASPEGDNAPGKLAGGGTLDADTRDAVDDTGNEPAANDDDDNDEAAAPQAGGRDDEDDNTPATPDDGGTHTEDTALADDGDGTRSNA
jgi:segregation and condensation protein B